MVKKKNYKSVFWKSLVLTLLLFLVGVAFGMIVEHAREVKVQDKYRELSFELLDSRLRTNFYDIMGEGFCDLAITDNLEFADKIYEEGKKIEIYERFGKLEDLLKDEKRNYALLKTEFWMNSVLLRDKCNADYTTLVYFYRDDPISGEEKQMQNVQSRILMDLKEKYGASLMLIPLPIDLDVGVVELYVDRFDIDDVPAILINEDIKLEGVHSLEEIEKLI